MRRAALAVLLGVSLGCSLLAGASTTKKPPAKKPTTSKKAKKKTTTRGATRTYGRQTQPDAARSREIQEALQREGFLKTPPSGKWDAATSDAFGRYQAAHGVKATGKPDARSLFSLGLGPKYPPQGSAQTN
jgi:hypothetical protein